MQLRALLILLQPLLRHRRVRRRRYVVPRTTRLAQERPGPCRTGRVPGPRRSDRRRVPDDRPVLRGGVHRAGLGTGQHRTRSPEHVGPHVLDGQSVQRSAVHQERHPHLGGQVRRPGRTDLPGAVRAVRRPRVRRYHLHVHRYQPGHRLRRQRPAVRTVGQRPARRQAPARPGTRLRRYGLQRMDRVHRLRGRPHPARRPGGQLRGLPERLVDRPRPGRDELHVHHHFLRRPGLRLGPGRLRHTEPCLRHHHRHRGHPTEREHHARQRLAHGLRPDRRRRGQRLHERHRLQLRCRRGRRGPAHARRRRPHRPAASPHLQGPHRLHGRDLRVPPR